MEKKPRAAKPRKVHLWSSLQTKFALTYIVVIAAVLVLLNTYPLLVSRDLVIKSKQTALQSQASVVASNLAGLENLGLDNRDKVDQIIGDLPDMGLGRIVITDAAGLILYDNGEVGDNVSRYALFGEVTQALRGEGYDVFRCEYRDGAFRSRAAAPVVYRNVIIGAVYFYEYDNEQGGLLVGIQNNLRNISIVICVAALLLSLVFSGVLTSRLATLLRAIRIVREGEYSHRVQLGGHDELALLADEFDQLTGRLQTTEEVRRRFVSDASHELKTPLTVILSSSDLLAQEESPTKRAQYLDNIRAESQRMRRLVEGMLTLARGDSGRAKTPMEPVALSELANETAMSFEPVAFEAGHPLEYELAENLTVRGRADELRQVFAILLDNAVKYAPAGAPVRLTLRESGRDAALEVEHPGDPIPPEQLAHLFDRFYRADASRSDHEGFGLGLSIAQSIVTAHRGTIRCRSDAQGTCFTVTLPLQK